MRKARDLIDRTDASRRILLGGGDQLLPTQDILQRTLIAMGFIDEAVETTERFVQTIDRIEKPFEIAWALGLKCNLCALLGQYDVLLQDAAKIIKISERHGYTARRGNGLSWRGLARSRLGELDAGIADVREGIVTQERTCWLCDLLVQSGCLDEASHLQDEADALATDSDDACVLADRDRGTSRDATPPTPPGIRVRTVAVRLS
jgi:hypothetical protein